MWKDLTKFFNKHWLILGPMAGVNDPIFRQLCIENGALLTYTEMVSSKALSYKNEKTKNLLELAPNEEKVVVQLFGHEPETMAQEAYNIEELLGKKLAYIDINMGCPAKKIVKKGDGAALMKTPKLACDIVDACNSACMAPISVKFRRGYNLNKDTSFMFAKQLEQAGASAICIHGRYAMQFYKGKANFEVANKIVNNVDIPVIWSGDVCDYSSANNIKQETGISAVMIARAARGNPWVFNMNDTYSMQDKIKTAKRHVCEYAKLNKKGLTHMRKHCMWYTRGMPGATIARNKFSTCRTVEDYKLVFDQILERQV